MSTLLKDILQRLEDLKTVTQFKADARTVEAAKGIVAASFANAEQGMSDDERRAYEWALVQPFHSVAADYARLLAKFIERQQAPTAQAEKEGER